jgi:hypothetical protein
MFKEKKEKKQQIPSQCFWKEKKNIKNTKTLYFEHVTYSQIFSFRGGLGT